MRQNHRFDITEYTITSAEVNKAYKIALLADIHDALLDGVMESVKSFAPDIIAINGDLINNYMFLKVSGFKAKLRFLLFGRDDEHYNGHITSSYNGEQVLRECSSICRTFFSLGNHERRLNFEDVQAIHDSGVTLLENDFVHFGDLCIGGQSSLQFGEICGERIAEGDDDSILNKRREQNYSADAETRWLDEFEKQEGFKLLLCHHPEYYEKYLKNRTVDLILSGHAHGGQIRFLNRGLYCPDEGFLPQYTAGFIDTKMIVSRGLANPYKYLPRINNRFELVFINLMTKK